MCSCLARAARVLPVGVGFMPQNSAMRFFLIQTLSYCAWGRFSNFPAGPGRMVAEIGGICGRWGETRMPAPGEKAGRHVGAVADAEQQRACRPVGVFVQL